MAFSNDQILLLVQAGGGFSIDVQGWTAHDLATVARAARKSGAQLTLVGADAFSAEELYLIVNEAPGHIFIVPRPAPVPAAPPTPLERRGLLRRLAGILSPSQLIRRPPPHSN